MIAHRLGNAYVKNDIPAAIQPGDKFIFIEHHDLSGKNESLFAFLDECGIER